jgi:predicted thioesterase
MTDLHSLLGRTASVTRGVGDAETAAAVGSGTLPVLGSPVLVAWLEAATIEALPLPVGSTSVGSHVDISHLAATPVGAEVTCEAEVIKVDGLRVTFRVAATHDHNDRVVARGTIDRVVVDSARFMAGMRP